MGALDIFRRNKALRYGVSGAALMVGAVVIVLGPAGPLIAASLAENANIWRLGRLHVEGVTGSGLGELRVANATLSDGDGIWARVENLRLSWKPLNLIFGDVSLIDASAARVRVLRQPKLAPARGAGGPVEFDTNAPAFAIASLELADGVAGPAATFALSGALRTHREAVEALHLDLRRLDKDIDSLRVEFANNGTLKLDAEARGAPGGAFAYWLQAPQSAVRLSAHADGQGASGAARLQSSIADAPFANGDLAWTAQGWRGDATIALGAAPALESYTRRFGPLLRLSAAGDPTEAAGAPFHAEFQTAQLAGQARGKLNDALKAVGAVALKLESTKLESLVPELDFEAGAVRFDGAMEFEDARTRLSGRLALEKARRNGLDIYAEGPAEVFVRGTEISFTGQLAASRIDTPEGLEDIFARQNLTIDGRYDRTNGHWNFPRIIVIGPNAGMTGAGGIDENGSVFTGAWDLPRIGVLLPGAAGGARGQWRLVDKPREAPLLTLDGAARQFAAFEPFGLLGPNPKLAATLSFTDAGTLVQSARAEGAHLRLGARGIVIGDVAKLSVEASARGPAPIFGLQFTGAADAVGTLTGPLGRPTVAMQANLATLDVAGATLHNVTTTFDLTSTKEGPVGRIGLEGALFDRPARVEARITPRGKAVAFEDVAATWVRLSATGRAEVLDGVLEGDLKLGGVLDGIGPGTAGPLTGTLQFSNGPKGGTIALEAALKRARLSGGLTANDATLSVHGPLDAMAARFALNGWAGEQPIALTGIGAGALTQTGFSGTASASGQFAGAEIATVRPIKFSIREGVVESDGSARIGAGTIEASWRGDLTRVAIDANLHDAPLEVLTAGFDQPAAGTLSGTINLSGARKSLAGTADLTFAQARLARRSRDAVDAHLTATLGGGTLRGKLEAKSQRGLIATLDAQIPMVAEAAPFQLVPVRGGVLDANWSLTGPVEGLWALFGPLDQSVGGTIDGSGAARFANGAVTGDGKLTLSGGTFDDKLSGVRLRAIEAELSFDDRGMTLDEFTATDGRQGRITGSGRLNGQDDGKLDLQLANMRLVDRPDAHATGGGNLALEWRGNGATLTGAITLNDAEIRVVDSGAAPVAQIDVVEINRPGPPARAEAKPVSAIPVKVDLRITAPGRVFTRTRGLEAEWSLDLALRGDLAKPALFGEARMLRGDFNLAGRRFEMDHGVIRFAGAAEDAEVDVLATADAPELTAKIALTGRALDPQIALSSDPPLPEDEILPQLLFGRSSRELSAFEAAQLAASLATLAGQSAFDIAGAARAAVALDRLEVREDAGGVLVAGGKYLTRDVYVEVSRGSLGKTATSLEWQVRPRLFVISSFLASGDQQVAVRWRREY